MPENPLYRISWKSRLADWEKAIYVRLSDDERQRVAQLLQSVQHEESIATFRVDHVAAELVSSEILNQQQAGSILSAELKVTAFFESSEPR